MAFLFDVSLILLPGSVKLSCARAPFDLDVRVVSEETREHLLCDLVYIDRNRPGRWDFLRFEDPSTKALQAWFEEGALEAA